MKIPNGKSGINKHQVKIAVFTAIVISSLTATIPAFAALGHGGGGGHVGGRGYGCFGLGLGIATDVLIGSELSYPYYYPYSYHYDYGPVVLPPESYISAPLVQVVPNAPRTAANVWYCESAKTHYPYTPNCAEDWIIVPATPPR